jgi:hypothetical protein
MRVTRRVRAWVAMIGAALVLIPVPGTLAATAATPLAGDRTLNLVTSPLPINLQTTPGKPISTDLRIKNGSSYSETLKVTLMKFSAFGEEGKPGIHDRGAGDDYFDWVKFSQNTFTAPPDQWVTLKMTISPPPSAAFGYYYAVVFSRAGDPQKPQPGQNVFLGSTAVLVLLDVSAPGATRNAQIVNFTANKHVYEFLPATFTVRLHNSGNVHLIPTGNIFIKRGKQVVATLPVNGGSGNVLPGSNRIFSADWEDGFPAYTEKEAGGQVILDDHDKPVHYLKWDFNKVSKLRIGHYTANLLMAYDNGKTDVPLEATLSFWVIPWRLIALVIAIPLIPALLVYWWTTWRFKQRSAREKQVTVNVKSKTTRKRKTTEKDDE